MAVLKVIYSLTRTAITKAWAFAQAFCVGVMLLLKLEKSRTA